MGAKGTYWSGTSQLLMYFIIIHSNNFDNFLSVNIIFDEDTKKVMMYRYGIVILNFKNYKRPIKQLETDIQVK